MPSRKGSSNKNKDFLDSRLKAMYGKDFDPIIMACDNALRMQSIADNTQKVLDEVEGMEAETKAVLMGGEFMQRKECVFAWDKIAQYTTPKLKALEVHGSGEDGGLLVTIQRKRFDGSVDA